MAQPIIQTSFNSGEWAPALNARVDVAKYHSGAALLENFFVDYRGGATASPGTRFVCKTLSDTTVRLIPFQASLNVSYTIEMSDGFARFVNNGSPVLEGTVAISVISNANPAVVTTLSPHGYNNGDWVYITGVNGMTQINGDYYVVSNKTSGAFELKTFFGQSLDTTVFGAYTSGGTTARVYTITTPYTSSELAQLKFTQNVNTMIFCHPNHPPYQLILTSATNWAFSQIPFGTSMTAPGASSFLGTPGGTTFNYSYVVTAVDLNGQESVPSAVLAGTNIDIRAASGSNSMVWTTVTGAVSYNIYKAEPRAGSAVPVGAMYGFVGNATGTTFVDSNIAPDYSQGPPVPMNPFFGSGVQTVTLTASGTYSAGTAFPSVSFTTGGGSGAAASAFGKAVNPTVVNFSTQYASIGDTIFLGNGVVVQVTGTNFSNPPYGSVTSVSIVNPGSIISGVVCPAPQIPIATSTASGHSLINSSFSIGLSWVVVSVGVSSPGVGYTSAPTVGFSSGGTTAVATLGNPPAGNPTVPGFFQQRLVLAGPVSNPQQINMSQPGAFYNFNVTNPVAPDNAFQGSLISGVLNTIQSIFSQPQGLIVLADQAAWLVNGGAAGAPISAISVVANPQVFAGASYPPPIGAVDNILYVQAKNSIVRDLVFNYNKQVYTGSDISILSSHLFYGYQLMEWAWAEEPFKLVYVTRSDGNMLVLTFLKEQELVAWSHRTTLGAFKSVATIPETSVVGKVNAVYTTVQRIYQGALVQYIERFVEQYYPNGMTDSWQVDAGLQYNGTASLTFQGARHLGGMTVTGLKTDSTGAVTVITPFIVPLNGIFTLPTPPSPATGYTRVTIGIAYTPKLQTLGINVGDPTIQGKMKKLPEVTVRVANTLGLSIGTDFNNLVDMEDLILGNVGKDTNQLVTNLVTGDAKQAIDPAWTVPGQYCIQQNLPYPATILGLIPQIAVGDTKDRVS